MTVPVVRCDGDCSGVLNPGSANVQLLEFNQKNPDKKLTMTEMKKLTVRDIRNEVDKYKSFKSSFFSTPGPELSAVKKLIVNKNDEDMITFSDLKNAIAGVATMKGAKSYREQLLNNPNNFTENLTGVDRVLKNISKKYQNTQEASLLPEMRQ